MPLNVVGGGGGGGTYIWLCLTAYTLKSRSVSANITGVERKRHYEDLSKIVVNT